MGHYSRLRPGGWLARTRTTDPRDAVRWEELGYANAIEEAVDEQKEAGAFHVRLRRNHAGSRVGYRHGEQQGKPGTSVKFDSIGTPTDANPEVQRARSRVKLTADERHFGSETAPLAAASTYTGASAA